MGTTRGVGLGMNCEWIGGLLSPPFYVEDGADAGRVSLVVWMEAPSGLVVGCEVVGIQDGDGAVTRVLLAALQTPLTLRDLLSGETRQVQEASGSQTLVVRDALLARIVEHDGGALLCGSHPRPLPPAYAAEVVRRARGRLRRRRAVPVERLRDAALGRYLIRRWEEAVAELDVRVAMPLDLRNTDGDPLLLTVDHFQVTPGARPSVEARLAALDDVHPPGPAEDPPVYVFLRPGQSGPEDGEATVIGHLRITDTTLKLETNSRARADALRERVEATCGESIKYRIREHTDPRSPKVAADARDEADVPPPPEVASVLFEFKKRHYATWPDEPLPALAGETPRAAVQTAAGRAAVDVLLKDMENREHRSAQGAPYDFTDIRRQLRLD